MSDKITKIRLNELKTIRLTCGHCKMVLEGSPAQLGHVLKEGKCPLCAGPVSHPLGLQVNPFEALGKALDQAQNVEGTAEVAFVLRSTDPEPA